MRFAGIIFLLLWGGCCLLLFSNWGEEKQERLNENSQLLKTTYLASVAKYQTAVEILFEDVIQQPEVIATVADGMLGNPVRAPLARGRLYRLLSPTYSHLKKRGIQELQFHTKDGHSFLRFHAPDKFGDPLFEVRPSVLLANTQKRPTYGFEADRLVAGLKYVFPLFKEKQHLGSVEASVSFRSLSEAMAEIDPGREYLLLLHKERLNQVLFPEKRALYATSPIHRSFLVEDTQLNLPGSLPVLSQKVQGLNLRIKDDPRVERGLSSGQALSLAIAAEDGYWAVSFEPIKDLFGENIAYIVAYSKAPYLTEMRRSLLSTLVFTSLAFLGLYFLTLRLLKSHNELRREKRHLLTITDTMADGLCVMDEKGRVVQINPAFTQLLGYRDEDVLGKVGHDLFHVHEDGKAFPLAKCPIISAAQKGEGFSGEETFRHKDGRLIPVEIVCKPFAGETGFEGSVSAFRDITERRAIRKRLAEAGQEVKFERDKTLSILESMADGISIQDPELRVIYQNAAHRKRMGDHLGEFCYRAYQGLDDICPECHLMRSFADGQVHIRETTASPAGELRHFQIVSTPLFDSDGKLIAGIESLRDITARVKDEEDLKKRTLQLEEANRELEAFSYTLSHDLRSYLSRITLAGESLQELETEHLTNEKRYLLGTILAASESMEKLITTMLALAHISQQEMKPQSFNLSALAEEISKELVKASPNRFLRFKIAPDIQVHGDRQLLRVALENLLGNACKYTREEPEAIISLTSRMQGGKRVIAVADNGTGFDMDEAEKLFRPFQRLSSARSFPGFGIGLTTVERIIKRHGGEIWAEATPGEGATFYFSLPD